MMGELAGKKLNSLEEQDNELGRYAEECAHHRLQLLFNCVNSGFPLA